MATKQFDARVQHKYDSEENWLAANPVPLRGELILVEMEDGEVCTKYGDGETPYADLPLHRNGGTSAVIRRW